jgi:hypothetical protein
MLDCESGPKNSHFLFIERWLEAQGANDKHIPQVLPCRLAAMFGTA